MAGTKENKKEKIKKKTTEGQKKQSFKEIFRENRKDKKIPKVRMIIVYLGTLVSYFFLISLLYFQDAVLKSLIALFVFFVFFHFAFLDLRHRGLKRFYYIFGGFFVLEILFLGFGNRQVLASVAILNSAAIILALWLNSETSDKRVFKSWSYFSVGGYIFTVFSVLAYSLFLLGGSNYNISCESLQKNSDSFVAFWSNPFKHGREEVTEDVKKTQEKVQEIFETEIKDILPSKEKISLVTTGSVETGNNILSNVTEKFHNIQTSIELAVQDNSLVNMGVCDLILGEIQERYNNPAFQISVLILMFVLLYPFVRIAFYIISFLSFLVFKLLYLLKVYRVQKIEQMVEEIL